MKEIQVEEYIRTNKGNIGKVIDIFKGHCTAKYHIEFQGNVKVKRQYLSTKTIVKHSERLKDLIEVKDIVNGYLIDEITPWGVLIHKARGIDRSGFSIPIAQYEEDIKTILTHEQYEKNYYKKVRIKNEL